MNIDYWRAVRIAAIDAFERRILKPLEWLRTVFLCSGLVYLVGFLRFNLIDNAATPTAPDVFQLFVTIAAAAVMLVASPAALAVTFVSRRLHQSKRAIQGTSRSASPLQET